MMPSDRGRWMAIDWGERRIGLALSDPSGTIASPAGVIVRKLG
jgi:RNase H-fold protein (predicted Holliday junction resolvase)